MSARSLNKVMLIGNLTRDPELRYTPSGTAVCSFSLATNRSWTPSDGGERKEETEFHRIVAWNKLAELCSQLLTKGRKVYIEGRLQTRSWETPEGGKRYSTEAVAEDMVILDSRRSGEDRTEDDTKETAEPVSKETPEESPEDKAADKEGKGEKKGKKPSSRASVEGKDQKTEARDEGFLPFFSPFPSLS